MSKALDLLKAQNLAYFTTHSQRIDVVADGVTYPALFASAPRTKGGNNTNEMHSSGPVITLYVDHADAIWSAVGRNGAITVDGTAQTLSQIKKDTSNGVWMTDLWLV